MYSRALITLRAVVGVSVIAVTACTGSVELPGTEGDLDGLEGIQCDVDSSNEISQAYRLTLDTAGRDTMCPRADRDYWAVTGGGPAQLLNVDVQYNKLSNVELRTDFYGPRGRCMDNALQPCTQSSDCTDPTKSYCDVARGGCREVNAAVCFSNVDCPAQQCYGASSAIDLIGTTRVAPSSALLHRLNANFPAFQAGDYAIAVYDHAEREVDASQSYTITVTQQTDTDPNEPNDLQNQATTIADNEELTGSMSYIGDVDYFRVQPSAVGVPAVIEIDLSYSASAAIAPTWSITQGAFEYLGPTTLVEGTGATAVRRQKTAVVTPTSGIIFIRVENASSATNTTDTYTLSVRVTTDPTEVGGRNDVIENATDLNAGGPGSGNITNGTHSLVAANDIDWYHLTRTGTDNSLLHVLANAATTDPYSLVVQVYRVNAADTCSPTMQCSDGRPCGKEGRCLDLMVQRPGPDGPGDPNLGGLVPNYQETQLPFYATPYYVRVVHDTATRLEVPGYDFESDDRYTLQLDHRTEPDTYERTTPDNAFVERPLRARNRNDFSPVYRTTGFTRDVVPASAGSPIATIPSSRIGSACSTQTVTVFDGFGEPLAAATVGLSATGATITDSCGGGAISSKATTTGTFTIGVTPSADDVVITTTVTTPAGGSPVTSYLTRSTGAINGITFAGNVERGVPQGSVSDVVQVRLPANAGSGGQDVVLQASAGAAILCGSGGTTCLNDDGGADYCDITTGAPSCRVRLAAGGNNFPVRVRFDNTGIGYIYVLDTATQERFQWTVFSAGHANATSYSITGYLSYDGDQDFFQIDPPASGLGPGGMTIFLRYPQSQVDIRASVIRGDRAVGVGYGGDEDIQESCETCDDGAAVPWSCNTQRQTCRQDLINLSAGPAASSPACGFSNAATGPIQIWVNEKSANDWDTSAMYEISVVYEEGCPDVCGAAFCN